MQNPKFNNENQIHQWIVTIQKYKKHVRNRQEKFIIIKSVKFHVEQWVLSDTLKWKKLKIDIIQGHVDTGDSKYYRLTE